MKTNINFFKIISKILFTFFILEIIVTNSNSFGKCDYFFLNILSINLNHKFIGENIKMIQKKIEISQEVNYGVTIDDIINRIYYKLYFDD